MDRPARFVSRPVESIPRQDAAVGGFGGGIGEEQQVGDAEQAEVHGEGVHPEEVRVLGVAEGDVAGHAFAEAAAGPVAEEGGHVGEGPEAVGGEGGVAGDGCGWGVSGTADEREDWGRY